MITTIVNILGSFRFGGGSRRSGSDDQQVEWTKIELMWLELKWSQKFQ